MKFERLNLHKDLLKGIAKSGFERCTPVQEQSLPESLAGKDIITQAQTGTGKTAVYLLSILNKLISEGKVARNPSALIMVPTRELAIQVDHDAKTLGKYLPFRSLAVYGGVGYAKQESELSSGVDIIAATPGRMIDLFKSKTLSLSNIDQFIIDEADRMFDMGFTPDIRYIAEHLPRNRSRQTMLFSATIDNRVIRLASKYMKPDPILVEIEPEQVTVDLIDQKLVYVSNEEKLSTLMGLLKRPVFERVIIFTNMKRTAERLGWKLVGNGFPAKVITGDVAQSKRQKIIDRMKSGRVKILVATEVAARGLHIEDVSHVINYDLPNDAANYVHRIGRTARAGKTGIAYSLVCEDHALNLPKIESFIDCKIKRGWVEESEMVKDRAGSFRKQRNKEKGRESRHSAGKNAFFTAEQKRNKRPIKKKLRSIKKRADSTNKRKPLPSSQEERIAYYKKKYGEDFTSTTKTS
jgi:ATP-dependent RNA helicase RhlB